MVDHAQYARQLLVDHLATRYDDAPQVRLHHQSLEVGEQRCPVCTQSTNRRSRSGSLHGSVVGGAILTDRSRRRLVPMSTGTQPYTASTENISMNENTSSNTPNLYGALWIGALLLASGWSNDRFLPSLRKSRRVEILRAVPISLITRILQFKRLMIF